MFKHTFLTSYLFIKCCLLPDIASIKNQINYRYDFTGMIIVQVCTSTYRYDFSTLQEVFEM